MNKLFEDKAVVLLTLYMIAACIYIVVVRPGNMHDASYWLYRIGALADEMSIKGLLHALPPRILSVTFNGYGYGAPLFYCDVFLWVPALLVLLGMSEMTSFVLLCAVIWGGKGSGSGVFREYRIKTVSAGKEQTGIVGSVCVCLQLFSIYDRGSADTGRDWREHSGYLFSVDGSNAVYDIPCGAQESETHDSAGAKLFRHRMFPYSIHRDRGRLCGGLSFGKLEVILEGTVAVSGIVESGYAVGRAVGILAVSFHRAVFYPYSP